MPQSLLLVNKRSPSYGEYIASHLHHNGYVMLPRWRCGETTIDIAKSLGTVVDFSRLLPESGIPTVQTLKPRHKINSSSSRYSGTYGLAEFPLHTDLAHWVNPPHYFILRCQKGVSNVTTQLLPSSVLDSILGGFTLRRALVRTRHPRANGMFLLPLVFCIDGISGFRWDSLFLVPMNQMANQVSNIMSTKTFYTSKLKSLTLVEPGDTLIINNWRCLHGRSEVSVAEIDRRLERVYLSDIYQ